MADRRFYEISIPTTVTVFIEGEGLESATASEHAIRYAQSLQASESESQGYSSVAFADVGGDIRITRGDLDVVGKPSANDTTDEREES